MTIIGVDIGGTKCAVIRADEHGIPRDVRRFPTTGVRETLENLYATIEGMDIGRDPVFGVSCGGPLDAHKGVILSPPNLPGWDRIPNVQKLKKRFAREAHPLH